MSHTPTPWKVACDPFHYDTSSDIYSSDDRLIAQLCFGYPEIEANAAFIVKAVNAHHDLVAALREARDRLRYDADLFTDQGLHSRAEASFTAMDACDTALAKVSS